MPCTHVMCIQMMHNGIVLAIDVRDLLSLQSSLSLLCYCICTSMSALSSSVEHRDRFYLQNPVSLVDSTDHISTVEVFAAATLDREERDYYQIVIEVSFLPFWYDNVL